MSARRDMADLTSAGSSDVTTGSLDGWGGAGTSDHRSSYGHQSCVVTALRDTMGLGSRFNSKVSIFNKGPIKRIMWCGWCALECEQCVWCVVLKLVFIVDN